MLNWVKKLFFKFVDCSEGSVFIFSRRCITGMLNLDMFFSLSLHHQIAIANHKGYNETSLKSSEKKRTLYVC